jgi:putative inorganic carbon (HCO3(-)) transporter
LLLLALIPLFWFPFRWPLLTLAGLPIIPIIWLLRLRACGRVITPVHLQPLVLGVLVATGLATIPIFDAGLAAPKVLGVALGTALLAWTAHAVRSVADVRRSGVVLSAFVLGLCAIGLVGSEWTLGKIGILDTVLSHLPVLVRGLVPNTTQGGINPNELAGILALCIPVLLAQALAFSAGGGGKGALTLTVVALVAAGMVLVAAQSRGAVGGVGVALAVFGGVLIRRSAHVRRTAVLAYFASLALMAGAGVFLLERSITNAVQTPGLDSLSGRVQLWSQAVLMVRDFPLTGIGLGQFDPVLHLLYLPKFGPLDFFVPHAHNLVLACAAETGLPGLIAFSLLFAASARECMHACKSQEPLVRWTGLGIVLGLLAFLVFGLTDAIAPGARGSLPLWALIGLGCALGRTHAKATSTGLERR